MGLPVRFIPHSIDINTAGSVAAWINQISGVNINQNVALFEESAGSETDREFVAVKSVEPTMEIPTSDLTFLATCGMSGIYISPASSKPGLIAYGRELSLGALPTAIGTANHVKVQVSDGLLVPVNVQASHNAVAKLALMLHAILGTTATYSLASPMVMSASQAIISGAGALVNLFTTGVMKFNSRLVKGITEINVSFGLQVFKEGTDGDVFPSHVSIIAREPKIEFSTRDVELATEVGNGVALTTFGAYFRAVNQNGLRIAEATTSHLGITGTLGMITPGAVGLTHKAPGTAAFTITPSKDTVILTITNGCAIPTT